MECGWAYPWTAQIFWVPPIISGKGIATDFKCGRYISRAYQNKSPLKCFWEKGAWAYPGIAQIFWGPLLSQERVKLRTSNFVGTLIESIGTKAHENVGNSGRGRSQAVPKIFRAPICRAHCAVIFAIAQLSCLLFMLLNAICGDNITRMLVLNNTKEL